MRLANSKTNVMDVCAGLVPQRCVQAHASPPGKIFGSGAKTTIVDAGGISNQVAVVGSEPKVLVTLSRMTFRNASGEADGGGVYICFGTLTVIDSIITLIESATAVGLSGIALASTTAPAAP